MQFCCTFIEFQKETGIMASKLQEHEHFILTALAQGHSYFAIAKSLADLGCKVNPSTIFSWAKKRARKLAARHLLVYPAPIQELSDGRPGSQDQALESKLPACIASTPAFKARNSNITPQPKTRTEKVFAGLRGLATQSSSLNWKKQPVI